MYTDGLKNQTNLGFEIAKESAILQNFLNKKNENLLRNDSLSQVLSSQKTSLNETITRWINANQTLYDLNVQIQLLEAEINSNLSSLSEFNNFLQTNQTGLQSLLSQLG